MHSVMYIPNRNLKIIKLVSISEASKFLTKDEHNSAIIDHFDTSIKENRGYRWIML